MSVQFVEFYHSHLSLSLLSPCSKKREIEASKVIFCRPKSGTLLALYSYDSKVLSLKHFTLVSYECISFTRFAHGVLKIGFTQFSPLLVWHGLGK